MRTNRKQEVSSTTLGRMTVVYLLMVLVGVACLVKILYLSIVERGVASGTSDKCVDTTVPGWEDLVTDDTYCYVRENMLRPVRGEIYDDHGRVLVANFTVFEVAFDGKGFAREYADTLKKNPKAYDEIFRQLETLRSGKCTVHSFSGCSDAPFLPLRRNRFLQEED